MTTWAVLAKRGAQGAGTIWWGGYNPIVIYSKGVQVTYGGSTYQALKAGLLGQPDISPTDWAQVTQAGASANTILSQGDVGAGVSGPASTSSSTPSWVDISGLAVAPNYAGPISLRLRGILTMSSTQGTITQYRMWLRILDDLGVAIGMCVWRGGIYTSISQYTNFCGDIDVTPGSIARTYKCQAAMTDATGGGNFFGGTSFGLAGNVFRLQAVPR